MSSLQPIYTMPVPPTDSSPDLAYYQAFVHAMNRTNAPSIAEKLRVAIELTATSVKTSPAHIARILVEYGLRAPRNAFPDSFVDFVENRPEPSRFARKTADIDVVALKDFWSTLLPGMKNTADERMLETA